MSRIPGALTQVVEEKARKKGFRTKYKALESSRGNNNNNKNLRFWKDV